MTKIIFVDDEPRVLDGIRRLLYPMRTEWEMCFAGGGAQALDIMAREPFDMIVTDVRMPGMDGTELLSRVRDLYPGVARIVLSGQSDRDLTLKSAVCAHQYLCKPCDADSLKVTIARAGALRAAFTDPSLQALVAGAGTLPSIPALYIELMNRLDDLSTSAQDVANIVAKDPAMTAKILQLSNSAFFGLRRRVSDPRDAVSYLGIETLKALALTVKVFSQFTITPTSRFSIDDLGKHTILTGFLARRIAIAEKLSKQEVEDAFMAGLLHDIGKLVMVTAAADRYEESITYAEAHGVVAHEAERSVFGTSHTEIGTYLLWLWGLPDSVVEAVAYHHTPRACPARRLGPLTAVHAADALSHGAEGGNSTKPRVELDMEYFRELGAADRVQLWGDLVELAAREQKAA